MRSRPVVMFSWVILVVVLGTAAWPAEVAAQGVPVIAREHIWLPPTYGATPLSTIINAQANYIAGLGDYLESASVARVNNAVAAEQEMKNALRWVDTYFEMREKNRAWRLKENPPHSVHLDRQQQAMRDNIDKYFQESLKGDVTKQLNWLLRELSGPALAYQYLPGDKTLAGSNLDEKLGPRDLHLLRLTDGGRGSKLVFPADDATVLETRWPMALRIPEFRAVREHFEKTRDEVLKELRDTGKLNWESEQKLMAAVDEVAAAFNTAYPREVRTESGPAYVEYAAGKRFVQALAAGVYRALNTQDRWVLDGSYKFNGDSVVGLIHHMYQNGLEFAPPEPGGEGVYKKMFFALRGLYLGLSAENPAPAVVKP
jgi:hypothetical protein